MIDLTLSARRELRLWQEAMSFAVAKRKLDWWLQGKTLEALLDFVSAQWGHLDELRGENRWLDSLPPESVEAREAELQAFFEALMLTEPPGEMEICLSVSLHCTKELAAAYVSQAANKGPEQWLLQQIREYQKVLEETRQTLLEVDLLVNGPVPPLMAETSLVSAAVQPASLESHQSGQLSRS